MAGCIGGLMSCSGVLRLFDVFGKIPNFLGRNIEAAPANDNKCKQIARIVANVFNFIGQFSIAVGMIVMGSTLFSAAPGIAFLAIMEEGLIASAPFLISSLASLTLSLMIRQAAH